MKNKRCKKCDGNGWYQYSGFNRGTPHSKPCEDCCDHEGKPFADIVNDNPARFYCRQGCGKEMPLSAKEKEV